MIGIAAVTLLFGVGAGAEKAYQAALETMGKNLLSVGAQRKQSNALRPALSDPDTGRLARHYERDRKC
jgi:hypothetical protein